MHKEERGREKMPQRFLSQNTYTPENEEEEKRSHKAFVQKLNEREKSTMDF